MRQDFLPLALLFSLLLHTALVFYPLKTTPTKPLRVVMAMQPPVHVRPAATQALKRPRPAKESEASTAKEPHRRVQPRADPQGAPRPAPVQGSPRPRKVPRHPKSDEATPVTGGAEPAAPIEFAARKPPALSPRGDPPAGANGAPPTEPSPAGAALEVEKLPASVPEDAPPPPSRMQPATKVDQQALLQSYASTVRRLITSEVRYPRKARALGLEGTVAVRLVLDRAGRIVSLSGEGDADLRQWAQEAVRRAAPFPPLPEGLERGQVSLKIPIRYRLEE